MSTIFADKFKNTSGGNNVKVNQLSGIDTAGSITVQGEGTATTNLQQGLAKAWVIEDHNTSNEIKDSLNVASVTDVGTGVSKFFYTNNMAAAEYVALSGMSSGVYNGATSMPSYQGGDQDWSMATTYWHHSTRGNGATVTLNDCERVVSGILGDLA